MFDQRLAGLAAALDHVEDAVGESAFGKNLRQFQRGGGGQLRGFEDHGVAGCQRWGGLPRGDLNGIVPGANAHAHTQRFAPGVAKGRGSQVHVLAVQRRGQTPKIFQAVGGGENVYGAGLGDGLARVQHFQSRQLIDALAEALGRGGQHPPSLGAGLALPTMERALGAGNSLVHSGAVGDLHRGQDGAGGRVDVVHSRCVGVAVERAVDVACESGLLCHDRPLLFGRLNFTQFRAPC